MTIHVPACPVCGMQVYRTKPETDEILPSDLYGNIGTVPIRTMVTAILARPCGHVMSGDFTEEDDGCRYRIEFAGEEYPDAIASPEDYAFHYAAMTDAVHAKPGWYATAADDSGAILRDLDECRRAMRRDPEGVARAVRQLREQEDA